MKEAMYYKKLEEKKVQCLLCPHQCMMAEGKKGICGARENQGGMLYSLVYGRLDCAHIDPIEKKPLYHFFPGTTALSICTPGCNLSCRFCQNADISQASKTGKPLPGEAVSPKRITDLATRNGCRSIAYTYTEPTIYYELALETAKFAHQKGIKNVFVTNGFINPEPLKEIALSLDAANIDLKAFSDKFYKEVCGARLQPVLDAIRLYHELGIWIEITTLVIPGMNDSEEELSQIAGFIASVDKGIPWHISRFHPDYRMIDSGPTPPKTLEKGYLIGKKAGLEYVYLGNVSQHNDTVCPGCGKTLIVRQGFDVLKNEVLERMCSSCSRCIPGRFQD